MDDQMVVLLVETMDIRWVVKKAELLVVWMATRKVVTWFEEMDD